MRRGARAFVRNEPEDEDDVALALPNAEPEHQVELKARRLYLLTRLGDKSIKEAVEFLRYSCNITASKATEYIKSWGKNSEELFQLANPKWMKRELIQILEQSRVRSIQLDIAAGTAAEPLECLTEARRENEFQVRLMKHIIEVGAVAEEAIAEADGAVERPRVLEQILHTVKRISKDGEKEVERIATNRAVMK